MESTVAEIKAILPSGALTDAEIQDLIDIATADVGSTDHSAHLSRTLELAVAKLKMAGKMPDSATVGPIKQSTNVTDVLDRIAGGNTNKKSFVYYNRG